MTAYTQGPWEYTPSSETYVPLVSIPGGYKPLIINTSSNSEENEGNAKLIAASPDMYSALIATWEQVRDSYDDNTATIKRVTKEALTKAGYNFEQ